MTTKLGARLREIMRGAPRGGRPAPDSDGESDLVDHIGSSAVSRNVPGDGKVPELSRSAGDETPQSVGRQLATAAARALGGSVHATPAGPCVVVERFYEDAHLHGVLRIGECAGHVHDEAPGLA